MVGRDVILEIDKAPAQPGAPLLRVARSRGRRRSGRHHGLRPRPRVRAGEIFGIAGVEGNGQRELVEAIAGMRAPSGGRSRSTARTHRRDARATCSEHGVGARARGPQQARRGRPFTIADNLVLNTYYRRPFARRRIRQAARHRRAGRGARRSATTSGRTGIHVPVSHLSGGNQQKVIIARELSGDVRSCCSSPSRRVGSTSARSSSSIAASSRCATRARRCCSCRPSSTRSSRSPTASACCTAASWSASSTAPTPRVMRVGLLMASGRDTCRSGAAVTRRRREPARRRDRDLHRAARALLRPAARARADLRRSCSPSRSAAS